MNLKTLRFLLKGGGIFRAQESSVAQSPGIQRQLEIYRKGVLGVGPRFPMAVEDLERNAQRVLKREAFDYVAGGAGGGATVRANRNALEAMYIVPRHMRGIADRSMGVHVFDKHYPTPLLIAPVGVLGIVHKSGELGVARAAASLGIPMVLSTASSHTLEVVANTLGKTPRWFQLYWPKDRELTASLVMRAEKAGYEAIVVTLDTFLFAWRERDLQNAYLPFLVGDGLANYFNDPVFRESLKHSPEERPLEAVRHFARIFSNPALTWPDLKALRKLTKLPIVAKGILHSNDARQAMRHGADGVIVSNHGGRQVDGAIASIDALPAVVKAVGTRGPVLFDGGIRRGADVFKALALGAKAVLVGRPYVWGLAVGGEAGVRHVLQNLVADFDLTMGLSGYRHVGEIDRRALRS
ncbi:MAG: alpha-hydroxy-acid oxidizing enzyme [Ignavibacteria bacterium RIFCSPLOWO2_02_FULL_55_14]|nr:MAG: alpha-hydroxy-acid oxidizing enzyme [Ignavibacteria bacterium RIFCSPHIGHO2_02_FULL_56_12]OGU73181.1 MAG: alpha-hydroxy-acid oxidizing enzyme [Ignavibacteria bacterium RIFCSPLOWO2_12_FULL_56_21]OGU75403.1 MAG: alpha-hydroxy-acid oxidizing enzyme [Ignavibacteria bacterium RIFCSPLOWO2_02_FULL_55_14]